MTAVPIWEVEEDGEAGWWSRYRSAMEEDGLSSTAIRAVELDSGYIFKRGVLGAGWPPPSEWPEERFRSGLVVGSVQSGKTASLVGVAAKALDSGVEMVVILAGTRSALWQQTFRRIATQLDGFELESASKRRRRRTFIPEPALLDGESTMPGPRERYYRTPTTVVRNLERGRPLVAVVMKEGHHLRAFGDFLRKVVVRYSENSTSPIHLLVIDDEADDGSILDSQVEARFDPTSTRFKNIPKHIVQLWGGVEGHRGTLVQQLYATYLAYTATPQANIAQSSHNPLAPRDFVVALRTPWDSGELEGQRSTVFKEPEGLGRYYTGGSAFYERPAYGLTSRLLPPKEADFATQAEYHEAFAKWETNAIADSVRAFLVASAVRLVTDGKSVVAARAAQPADKAAVKDLCPDPMSMLIHPAASMDSHLRYAQLISAWSAHPGTDDATAEEWLADGEGRPRLSATGLAEDLDNRPEKYRDWLDRYAESREAVNADHDYPLPLAEWSDVRRALSDEVIPHCELRVINSDDDADDKPRFDPEPDENGLFTMPPDTLSIFVSGNVMARGITLRGLTTSLFLRGTATPAADTQMQMQRWLGYRGPILNLCRLFAAESQLKLFHLYHDSDEAQKLEIIGRMNAYEGAIPPPAVLQGRSYRATGKLRDLRTLPLHPGPKPFVRLIDVDGSDANQSLLGDLLAQGSWDELVVNDKPRGLYRTQSLSLVQVAEILESMRFGGHRPDPESHENRRWKFEELKHDIPEGLGPFFRPPGEPFESVLAVNECPYSIAAYLRFWNAMMALAGRGLCPTDDYSRPWATRNRAAYLSTVPTFQLVVRYGGSGLARHPVLAQHGIRRMVRAHNENGIMTSAWGSRGTEATYHGDERIDYHITGKMPPLPGAFRPRGDDGLLLFHVVEVQGRESDAVTVGLSVPLGGPDHFAVLRQ